jgi:predicted anti-sigma-YlaC factor YlaD
MSNPACEEFRLAAMALLDGETATLPAERVRAHLAVCAECRQEIAQFSALESLLGAHRYSHLEDEVWPLVASRLSRQRKSPEVSGSWGFLVLLVFILLAGRACALATDGVPGLVARLSLLLFAVALFWIRKENPFAINPQLKL